LAVPSIATADSFTRVETSEFDDNRDSDQVFSAVSKAQWQSHDS